MRMMGSGEPRLASHPLAVGFERIFSDIESLAKAATTGFPPYDVEMLGEDRVVVSVAVAGFSREQLSVLVEGRFLTVSGRGTETGAEDEGRQMLHRGIARRAFERRFVLAEHLVPGGVTLENGILQVEINREVPESAKPRSIAIGVPASTEAAQA